MDEKALLEALVARTRLNPDQAKEALEALLPLLQSGPVQAGPESAAKPAESAGCCASTGPALCSTCVTWRPSEEEVEALIAQARAHPLGEAYLLKGELGSVAVTFGTHAFTVDAARQKLRAPGY